jgi:hypothetical protein
MMDGRIKFPMKLYIKKRMILMSTTTTTKNTTTSTTATKPAAENNRRQVGTKIPVVCAKRQEFGYVYYYSLLLHSFLHCCKIEAHNQWTKRLFKSLKTVKYCSKS